jgi:CRP-like cAMP-binding protein
MSLTGVFTMLTTIEKVITLKTVSIFSQTADEVLAEIASILKDRTAQAGETIVRKGEMGNSLYIIVAGQVRVHDGDHTLTHLEDRDIFGELSVLDAEPRSATVTATMETQLFCLDQESLFELMATRVEVIYGIMRVLCQRVRQQNQKLVQASQ